MITTKTTPAPTPLHFCDMVVGIAQKPILLRMRARETRFTSNLFDGLNLFSFRKTFVTDRKSNHLSFYALINAACSSFYSCEHCCELF